MTNKEMSNLKAGDIVRHKSIGQSQIVTANYGDRVTVVRTSEITNPNEWIKIKNE